MAGDGGGGERGGEDKALVQLEIVPEGRIWTSSFGNTVPRFKLVIHNK